MHLYTLYYNLVTETDQAKIFSMAWIDLWEFKFI